MFQKQEYMLMYVAFDCLVINASFKKISIRRNLTSGFLGRRAGAPTHSLSDTFKSAISALLSI